MYAINFKSFSDHHAAPLNCAPDKRVLFSIFVPEDAVDGLQLGTLVKDLNFLEPFGLPEATIAECKLYDFVSAQVGSESSKFAGTSIGKLQQMADILAMGVTSISVIVRPREAPMSSTETGEAPMSTTETGRRRSFLDVLVRTQVATFPDWGGGGNKALWGLVCGLEGDTGRGRLRGLQRRSPRAEVHEEPGADSLRPLYLLGKFCPPPRCAGPILRFFGRRKRLEEEEDTGETLLPHVSFALAYMSVTCCVFRSSNRFFLKETSRTSLKPQAYS